MKVKTTIRISKRMLTLYPAIFLVGLYAMLEKTSVMFAEYAEYKKSILILIFLFLLPRIPDVINSVAKKRHFPAFCILAAFTLMVLISSQQTKGLVPESRVFYRSIFLIGFIAELYCTMIYACERKLINTVIQMYAVMAWIVMLISDAVFLYSHQLLQIEVFLVGSKFTLIYQHIYALAFYLLSNQVNGQTKSKHTLLLLVFTLYTIFIALRADCMTGLLGFLLFVILWVLMDQFGLNLVKPLADPVIMASLLAVNLLITFSFELILQNPNVEEFIVDVLGRSTTLTGRLNIYRDYLPLTKDHLMWGFGMGTQYTVCMYLFHYADTQNAILEWIIQLGVPTTFLLLLTFLNAFSRLSRSGTVTKLAPLVLLIYVYVFMGIVEITFSLNFILWTAIVYGYSQASRERKR